MILRIVTDSYGQRSVVLIPDNDEWDAIDNVLQGELNPHIALGRRDEIGIRYLRLSREFHVPL